ncbi:GntR family transcriptional regulator [Halomonas denitrificans]|nr:GntR family transcriptional regulator [Halomonas denitrificans]
MAVQKNSPTLVVDLDSSVPVVQQIAGGLRRCLLDGDLRPGDALPSSRALARDLGVHFNTVVQAYRELEAEGWLELRRRAGTVVVERRAPRPGVGERERLARRFGAALDDLLARYEARGLDRADLEDRIDEVLDRSGTSERAPARTPAGKGDEE